MSANDESCCGPAEPVCCPCGGDSPAEGGTTRRGFMGGSAAALGAVALTGLSWSALSAAEGAKGEIPTAPARRALVVKPVFVYSTPKRRPKASWRNWGGVQTQDDADKEAARIADELAKLKAAADFPVKFLPVAAIRRAADLSGVADMAAADVVIMYPAGGWTDTFDAVAKTGKDMIVFVRHKSGPVYLWYEIVHPRYLRRHSDKLSVEGVDYRDVVVDSQKELLWRLRALCGLRNTIGMRILAVGGPGGWATRKAPDLARERWKLDIRTVSYKDLGELIKSARADKTAVQRAAKRAGAYLKLPGTKLETGRDCVDKCFLLEEIFRALMKKADCRAITINSCMGTIMRVADTTACLPLSTLNDDGYLAFCESDFVVIPAGLLMGGISGLPPFLLNPTYPYDGIMTMAHCTAPRKMDGKKLEPARIVTHFESDFGAAPKVDMKIGQKLTLVGTDFAAKHWIGCSGRIVDHPFLPICRSQIDVAFNCDTAVLAERMQGFHWMIIYGNYLREIGYALKRTDIEFESLG